MLVRASALYDLVLTSAFAIPIVAGFKIDLLRSIHVALSLSGDFPTFTAMHLLFLNLLGSVVIVWSVLRIRRPEPLYGFYDGLCRLMFSSAMGFALFAGNGSAIIWAFLIPEMCWGVVQLLGYVRLRSTMAQA
ncbi:hypothetical protein MED297_07751 [Reinekea sp. MED297]|uniref:Uncharacterized protein n=2 Tax=Reinekea TaxID=230494 RepID=A4BCN3_9GAMM|nr:hypothetical protein MED297_07751 [Reinekea sp. MED297] [Reinekea blandensis MED297]